jgi:hypothetical protein
MRGMRWWVLAFLAAVVLLGSAGGLLWQRRPKPPPPASAPPVARVRCPDADAPAPALVLPAETVPVLVGASGKVAVLLDQKPVTGGPEAPLRLPAGKHTLRASAGESAMELTFQLERFHPALFHFEETPGLGLTLVWSGATCTSCPPPGKVALDFTRTSATDQEQLEEAAKSLRTGNWSAAGSRLRGVQPKARQEAPFLRLAANVYQSAGRPEQALEQLHKLPVGDVGLLLRALEPFLRAEAARENSPGLERWNLLTERFATLLEKFALEAPGPVQLATSRLAELTTGFLEATEKKDTGAQEETVTAAEEALAQFVRTLRRSRPEDCAFQARISASL